MILDQHEQGVHKLCTTQSSLSGWERIRMKTGQEKKIFRDLKTTLSSGDKTRKSANWSGEFNDFPLVDLYAL